MTFALVWAGASVVNAPSANASVTTLCKGIIACVKAGMSDNWYSSHSRTMFWRMYAGNNCTNYAAYRVIQNGGPQTRPWTGSGNATNWGSAMSRITDSTPTVGSIAWWRAGVKPAGRSGHVAYVERVVSAEEIIISQDSWGGEFSWARVTRSGGGWPSGFIHFSDVPLVNTAPPSITGTAKVGSELTASPGLWSAGAEFAYQWTQNGVDVPGARAATLTVTRGLKGRRLAVRVTATTPGYDPVTVTSAATPAVGAGALRNTTAPTVVGVARVGAVLEASPGAWSTTPDAFTYQWLVDGVVVPGATTRTMSVAPGHVGRTISVMVTAMRSGYDGVAATSPRTSRVRAVPVITVTTRPGSGRLAFAAHVRAGGVDTVAGRFQVRSRGKLVREFRVQQGVVAGTVTGLPPGARTYRFWFLTTANVARGMVERRLTVR